MFFWKEEEILTQEQKIDEIYKMLKSEQRQQRWALAFRWIIRLLIIGLLIRWYAALVVEKDTNLQKQIQSFIVDQLGNIVSPVVNNVIQQNPQMFGGANSPTPVTPVTSSGTDVNIQPNTRRNIPKKREINELLKDEELMKAATEIFEKGQTN